MLDTYVGLPWLLKKLAVNMLTNRANGHIFPEDSDPIKQLFDGDLEGLSTDDHACIRAVASNAPIPIHSLALNFSENVISGLIERRLLINSGGQLSLYSDIFRDYVLYKRLPKIPNTYCPYVSVPKFVQAITLLSEKIEISYLELSEHLKVTLGSVDNIARDLHQMGIVKLHRAGGQITVTTSSNQESTSKFANFLRSHIILESLNNDLFRESGAEFTEIVASAVSAYRFSSLSNTTIEQYCAQILRLAGSIGLVEKAGGKFLWGRPIRDLSKERPRPVRVMTRTDGFMGQAPPSRVFELITRLKSGTTDKIQLVGYGLRNAIFAATSLGLVRTEGNSVRLERNIDSISQLLEIANDQEFLAFVKKLLLDDPSLSGAEIGSKLADAYGFNLHPASLGRYGSALRRWI